MRLHELDSSGTNGIEVTRLLRPVLPEIESKIVRDCENNSRRLRHGMENNNKCDERAHTETIEIPQKYWLARSMHVAAWIGMGLSSSLHT